MKNRSFRGVFKYSICVNQKRVRRYVRHTLVVLLCSMTQCEGHIFLTAFIAVL